MLAHNIRPTGVAHMTTGAMREIHEILHQIAKSDLRQRRRCGTD